VNAWPIHFVFRQYPGLLARRRLPFVPSWQRHHDVHVSAGYGTNRHGIGVEPSNDRHIHGVGCAKASEQKVTARAVTRATIGPYCLDTPHVRLHLAGWFTGICCVYVVDHQLYCSMTSGTLR